MVTNAARGTVMELRRGKGEVLWRQIQKILEQDIADGVHAPGEQLPTEHALAARFKVNRHTVRRALSIIEERGLIRMEQGRGTFVQENVVHYSLDRRVRFSENLNKQGRLPGGRVLYQDVVRPPRSVSAALHLSLRAEVEVLETLSEADGQPLCLTTRYFPAVRFPGFADRFRVTGSVTAAYAHFGIHDYTRKSTVITARMPRGKEAELLAQPRTRPILAVESVNVDLAGAPIEYGFSRWASDRVQFVVET